MNSDTTLYAVWQEITYNVNVTLTYDTNTIDTVGNMPARQTVEKGKTIRISGNEPTRDGYKFKGWSTLSGENNSVEYIAGTDIIMDSDKTLYAVWEESNKIKLYFYGSGANFEGRRAPTSATVFLIKHERNLDMKYLNYYKSYEVWQRQHLYLRKYIKPNIDWSENVEVNCEYANVPPSKVMITNGYITEIEVDNSVYEYVGVYWYSGVNGCWAKVEAKRSDGTSLESVFNDMGQYGEQGTDYAYGYPGYVFRID